MIPFAIQGRRAKVKDATVKRPLLEDAYLVSKANVGATAPPPQGIAALFAAYPVSMTTAAVVGTLVIIGTAVAVPAVLLSSEPPSPSPPPPPPLFPIPNDTCAPSNIVRHARVDVVEGTLAFESRQAFEMAV
jgi:hypothetical protein